MSWYYNQTTGVVIELVGPAKFAMDREIDLEKAAAKVGAPQGNFGPFATQANAESFKAAHPSLLGHIVQNPISGAKADIASFFNTAVHDLETLAIRVLEGAAGIVLLAIALNVVLKQATGKDIAGAGAKRVKQGAELVVTKKVPAAKGGV